MSIVKVSIDGQILPLNDLNATLRISGPSRVELRTSQRFPAEKGTQASIEWDESKLDLVVNDFAQPVTNEGDGWAELVDPITAADLFFGEALSRADQEVGLRSLVETRFPVQTWPDSLATNRVVVANDVTLADILAAAANLAKPAWYLLTDGKIVLQPEPSPRASEELKGTSATVVADGTKLRCTDDIPPLGSWYLWKDASKIVRMLTIHQSGNGEPSCHAVLGEIPQVPPPGRPSMFLERGCIVGLNPLTVQVEGIKSNPLSAELLCPRSAGGKAEMVMPLAMDDSVLVLWPRGLWTGTLRILPFAAVSDAAEEFQLNLERWTLRSTGGKLIAQSALKISSDDIDITTQRADFHN